MNSAQVAALQTLLSTPKKIAIIPHKNPDGDAIGSSLGLYHYLLHLGNHVQVVSPNDYPKFLKWMPGSSEVLNWEKENSNCVQALKEADAIFTLDFNDLRRAGDMATLLETLPAPFVMIDHHREPTEYAQIMFSESAMSSTSEMVYHIISALGHEEALDKNIASCLYAGIVTDTGSFKFSATTASTHQVAAKLIEKGASNNEIHTRIYDNNSADRLYLLSTALQNMKIFPEYRTSYMTLSEEELKKHNFKKGDTEGFVNYGLSIDGIDFTAIFIENGEEGLIKISLRSNGDFDVNTFARANFQGGGHKNAAGGRMIGSLEETATFFESLLEQYKSELAS
ncbi:MAG: bifunctional oligoribonuclease/PAP phosphatase NrnA [Eudoraea sp.]|nr:bifunctional oligoribonuclease/PAP phosphatase NrnA [Eudoraea sp.]